LANAERQHYGRVVTRCVEEPSPLGTFLSFSIDPVILSVATASQLRSGCEVEGPHAIWLVTWPRRGPVRALEPFLSSVDNRATVGEFQYFLRAEPKAVILSAATASRVPPPITLLRYDRRHLDESQVADNYAGSFDFVASSHREDATALRMTT